MKLKNMRDSRVRNYGFGSRDPKKSVINACNEYYASYSTAHQMAIRFHKFLDHLSANQMKISDLRHIKIDHLQYYAKDIGNRVEERNLSTASAHNYISAVNSVMKIVTGKSELFISTRFDTSVPNRCYITRENKASMDTQNPNSELSRLNVLVELQRTFGLRFEESTKINAKVCLKEARETGKIFIQNGTKGGRFRSIPITNQNQLVALEFGAIHQQNHWSLIPPDLTYADFQAWAYRHKTNTNFHAYRHAYAQRRYTELMGAPCPVAAKIKHGKAHHQFLSQKLNISFEEAKQRDKFVRRKVSLELGHNRINVTNHYLG